MFNESLGELCPRCLYSLGLGVPDEVSLIGETISHYQIVAKLGSGGMGDVYEAEDTRLGRKVALKLLSERFCLSREALLRFQREARLASSLNNPHICTVYDLGEYHDRPFIVMELLTGNTVSQLVANVPLPAECVIRLGMEVAQGLEAAHASGIIHRDIKPTNIFVTERGETKILDFGLAKENLKGTGTDPITEVTSRGGLVGTLPYMSPEQLTGQPLDARTDLFSLGTVLHEMVTGRSPYIRSTPGATVHAILNETLPPARTLCRDCPPKLSQIVKKLQNKEPRKRYQNASELLSDLEALHGSVPAALPLRKTRHLKKPGWRSAAILLMISVAVLLSVLIGWWDPSRDIDSVAVLPFENLSEDLDLEFFADGMTDALISSLAGIGELRVSPRTSVMRFKASDKTLSDMAKELEVDVFVEGSVQPTAEEISVRFSLIDAKTEEIFLTRHYRRGRADFVKIQDEIASAIAQEILVTVTPELELQLRGGRPSIPEAYESYMKGLYLLNKRHSLELAIDYLERAAKVEPENALIRAHLAHGYLLSASTGYGEMPANRMMPLARDAASKALELDPDLAEAHAALALVSFSYDWDWKLAERHFEKAKRANPRYATAYHWHGLLLAAKGDLEEAMSKIDRARELDPYSPVTSTAYARIHYYQRNYREAEKAYREALELEPDFVPAWLGLGLTHLARGNFSAAAKAFRTALPARADGLVETFQMIAQAQDGAERLLEIRCDPAAEAYCSFSVAIFATISGFPDEAFYWLNRAFDARSEYLVYLKADPIFDRIREDERYSELLEKIGLD